MTADLRVQVVNVVWRDPFSSPVSRDSSRTPGLCVSTTLLRLAHQFMDIARLSCWGVAESQIGLSVVLSSQSSYSCRRYHRTNLEHLGLLAAAAPHTSETHTISVTQRLPSFVQWILALCLLPLAYSHLALFPSTLSSSTLVTLFSGRRSSHSQPLRPTAVH